MVVRMEGTTLFAYAVVLFAVAWGCGMFAGSIARRKNAAMTGFWCGFFLGPLGILIAALALDGRPPCPACGERINNGASKCGHCREPLNWLEGEPLTHDQLVAVARRR
jgi:hypothetical protein